MMAENGTQVKKIPMELQPESEFRFRGDFRTAVTIPLKVKNTSDLKIGKFRLWIAIFYPTLTLLRCLFLAFALLLNFILVV